MVAAHRTPGNASRLVFSAVLRRRAARFSGRVPDGPQARGRPEQAGPGIPRFPGQGEADDILVSGTLGSAGERKRGGVGVRGL